MPTILLILRFIRIRWGRQLTDALLLLVIAAVGIYILDLAKDDRVEVDRWLPYVTFDPAVVDTAPFHRPFFLVDVGASHPDGCLADGEVGRGAHVTTTFSVERAGTLVFVEFQVDAVPVDLVAQRDTPVLKACFVDALDPSRRHVEWAFISRPHLLGDDRGPFCTGARPQPIVPDPAPSAFITTVRDALLREMLDAMAARREPDFYGSLHAAAGAGQDDALSALLSAASGAEQIDAADAYGCSPLHRAAYQRRVNTVQLLIDAGADPSPCDLAGRTPLHYAARLGYPDIARVLLRGRAEVDTVDGEGRTPLFEAVSRGHSELVYQLLEALADPNIANASGDTPLHVTAGRCQYDLTIALLDRGANARALDARGRTPANLAEASGAAELAELLRKAEGR